MIEIFLRINSLELVNIRCFERMKFHFNEGVNVISGPNGSGKSTIITAIGFALYGPSYLSGSGLTKTDLIKREEPKGRVSLTFTTPKGKYTSRRTVKIKGSDVWKVYQEGYWHKKQAYDNFQSPFLNKMIRHFRLFFFKILQIVKHIENFKIVVRNRCQEDQD